MKRPKREDFKPEYIKGCAEISSGIKQYLRKQEEYIDYLLNQGKKLSIHNVRKRLCTDCIISYEFDWAVGYDKCPKCGNDKA